MTIPRAVDRGKGDANFSVWASIAVAASEGDEWVRKVGFSYFVAGDEEVKGKGRKRRDARSPFELVLA